MPNTEVLIALAAGTVTVGAAIGYMIKAGRFTVSLMLGMSRVIQDWQGQPDRPGEPAQPSLPRRLEQVEREVRALSTVPARLDDLEARLHAVATATGAVPVPTTGRNST